MSQQKNEQMRHQIKMVLTHVLMMKAPKLTVNDMELIIEEFFKLWDEVEV